METLGGPLLDDAANRELFEEQVEIMLKAWHEPEFAHAGAAYRVPADVPHMFDDLIDITLVPRPAHLPVEVWQPITSSKQRGFDYMARHGIKGVIAGGTAPGGQAEQGAALYRDALARAGRETELGEGLAVGFQMHLGDSREAALLEATPWAEEHLKGLAPLGRYPQLSDAQVRATAQGEAAYGAGLPTIPRLGRRGNLGVRDAGARTRPPARPARTASGPAPRIHPDRFPGRSAVRHAGRPGVVRAGRDARLYRRAGGSRRISPASIRSGGVHATRKRNQRMLYTSSSSHQNAT